MKDEIQVSSTNIKKDALVATLGADFTNDSVLFGKNSQSRAELSYTFGELSFRNSEDRDIDKAGANTEGVFSKINIELAQDFDLDNKIKWENSLKIQYALANKNLDGSQDLSTGGAYGVRYYPDAEESAENGFIFNTELFYALPEFKKLNSKVSMFYDVGRVSMSKNISDEKARTLQDIGVGYTGTYENLYLNTHLAKNISKSVESERSYNVKFLLQAGLIF
jgi:hemolysin activation/secretion protein